MITAITLLLLSHYKNTNYGDVEENGVFVSIMMLLVSVSILFIAVFAIKTSIEIDMEILRIIKNIK